MIISFTINLGLYFNVVCSNVLDTIRISIYLTTIIKTALKQKNYREGELDEME